jgi:transaldolase
MSKNLVELSHAGVSIWLDDLSRERLQTGTLAALIEGSSVVGVTTNPSIFSAAISGSDRYAADIKSLAAAGKSVDEIVTQLTTDDVRSACDLFAPIFAASKGADGRVSIEVEPGLAYDTATTITRGIELAKIVDRPNLLIKVPATREGLPAIEELTAAGISVNVTLIFSVERYVAVMNAYLSGLERRVAKGESIADIHSVASFFISRIDSEIDKRLDAIAPHSPLRGTIAVANAHLAYEAFLAVAESDRWKSLAAAGANFQRPLWASTGVKDKAYESTRYVIELVAAHCVNTMPEGTLNETRDHGVVRGDTITAQIPAAHTLFAELQAAGVDFADVVKFLEDDGVAKFQVAWKELLANIEAVAK